MVQSTTVARLRAYAVELAFVVLASGLLLPLPAWPAEGDCSQPVSSGAVPSVSDCLFILRTAVGISTCDPACICAPKGTLPISAADALLCLKKSVGQNVTLSCPCEATTSTTNTTTTSQGLTTTTTTGTTTTTHGPTTTTTTGTTTTSHGLTTTTTIGTTTTSHGPTTTSTAGATTTTTVGTDIETQTFPNACVSVTLRASAAFTTKVRANAAITIAIDHASIGDRDIDGLEEVEAEITSFLLTTTNALLGTVTVQLPDPDIDTGENRRTLGLIEETANTTPGVLDVPPYSGAGTAAAGFDLFIQASFTGGSLGSARLHHHVPIGLAGIFSHSPPAPGELLEMQNTENIPILQDDEAQYGTATIDTEDKATIDLSANGCD